MIWFDGVFISLSDVWVVILLFVCFFLLPFLLLLLTKAEMNWNCERNKRGNLIHVIFAWDTFHLFRFVRSINGIYTMTVLKCFVTNMLNGWMGIWCLKYKISWISSFFSLSMKLEKLRHHKTSLFQYWSYNKHKPNQL